MIIGLGEEYTTLPYQITDPFELSCIFCKMALADKLEQLDPNRPIAADGQGTNYANLCRDYFTKALDSAEHIKKFGSREMVWKHLVAEIAECVFASYRSRTGKDMSKDEMWRFFSDTLSSRVAEYALESMTAKGKFPKPTPPSRPSTVPVGDGDGYGKAYDLDGRDPGFFHREVVSGVPMWAALAGGAVVIYLLTRRKEK